MSALLDTDTTETQLSGKTSPFSSRVVYVASVRSARSGKSAATSKIKQLRKNEADFYTSLTLAGLERRKVQFSNYYGHIIIDDLGSEKSLWSRTATVAVLANLVHTHYVQKITQGQDIGISDFYGSAALNIQPILMNSIVRTNEWIAVTRDKTLRYYHLFRPIKPIKQLPEATIDWGESYMTVALGKAKGVLWNRLVALALSQWSHARCIEHLPALLKGAAALDGRTKVDKSDYKLLLKLLKPMTLERDIIDTYGFEEGRNFLNNTYCILTEIASYGEPTILNFCIDYKCSPSTVERLILAAKDWCWIKGEGNRRVVPHESTREILKTIGVYDKW